MTHHDPSLHPHRLTLQPFMLRYPEAAHIDQDLLNPTFAQRVHWLAERLNHPVNLTTRA
jgi:hypothetical protein